jgi:fibronectin-binding autotransporter adhesin
MLSFDTRHWAKALACAFTVYVTPASPLEVVAQTTSTWQASGVATWNDPANWTSGVPMLAGDVAIFGPGFPTGDVQVLVADPTTTVGTLTYNNPFQFALLAPALTFDGNGGPALIEVLDGQLDFQSGGFNLASDLEWSVAPGLTASVGAEINPAASFAGPGGLSILGGGAVILNGANTYSGATHINSGLLRVQHNDSLGLGTGTEIDGTFIHTGGSLEIGSDTLTLPNEKITIDGGTLTGGNWKLDGPIQLSNGALTGGNWITNGPLNVSGGAVNGGRWKIAAPLTLDGMLTANGGIGWIAGQVSGTGGIDLNAPGQSMQITNANTYTGQTIISGGTLNLGQSQSLGAGTGTDADGTIVRAGGTLQIGLNVLLANEKITLDGGELRGATGVAIQLDAPITSDGGTFKATDWVINSDIELPGDLTIDAGRGGTINGTISGPGALIFTRGDVGMFGDASAHTGQTRIENNVSLTVQGASSLGSGETVIDAGELWVTHPMALNGGTITVNTLGQLHFQDIPSAVVDINLAGGAFNTVGDTVLTGQIELGAGTNTINSSPSRDLDLNLDISGRGDLRYAQGTVLLNKGYSYTGQTIIDGSAVVRVGHANGLGDLTSNTLVQGGTLVVGAPTDEPLVIRGGIVTFDATSLNVSGPITMSGGELAFSGGPLPFATPITLEPGISTIRSRDGILAGGTVGSGDLRFNFGSIVDGAPLAHDGGVDLDFENVRFNTPNSYTGITRIHGGSHVVNHADALGDNLAPTILDGGDLTLNVVPDEDIEIRDGTLRNLDPVTPVTRPITMSAPIGSQAAIDGVGVYNGQIFLAGDGANIIRGGVFNGDIQGDKALTLFADNGGSVLLNSANSYSGGTWVSAGTIEVNIPDALGTDDVGTTVTGGLLKINVATPEPIAMDRFGAVALNVQLATLPDLLPGAMGWMEINSPSQYDEKVDMDNFELRINADAELGGITMRGDSRLSVNSGAALTLADDLLVHSGRIMGDLSGVSVIRKQTSGRVFIREASGLNGRLILEKGVVWLEQASLTGSPTGTIEFTPGGKSGLWLQAGAEIDAEVFLNNNHGYDHRGALYTLSDSSSRNDPIFRGDVNLGDIGATIGGEDGLTMAGGITGGDLTLNFDGGAMYLTSDRSTYTGVTDLTRGKLILRNDGKLSTTEKIIIGTTGSLGLSNNETPMTDRVADHIPIEMYGGSLGSSVTERTTISETFGDLTLVRGNSEIDGGGGLNKLTFQSLTQDPSATVLMHIDENLEVFFQQAPVLENGILGGSFYVRGDDNRIHFATYNSALGVRPVAITPHTVNTAGPNDNVTHANGAPILATDTSINSLDLRGPLDLGGNTLRIESGGFIGGSTISNGNLTAGDGTGGTLYLYGGTIEASLTDDGSNRVNIVSYASLLSGENTYSGSTTINARRAIIENEAALPQGTDIILNGSGLEFRYISDTPRQFGTLTLRDGALVEESFSSRAILNFSALELEAGEIREVELVGAGPMRKTTLGTVVIESVNPGYGGAVEIFEGVLDARRQDSLGTGNITIFGGQLTSFGSNDAAITNDIILAGGSLTGSDNTQYNGTILVSAPSTIEHLRGDLIINSDLSGSALLTFDKLIGDSGVIRVKGSNTGLTGPVHIRGGIIRVEPQASDGLGSGPVWIFTGGRLELATVSTANNIHLNGGDLSSREVPAVITGLVSVHSDSRIGSFNDGYDLVLSGGMTLDNNLKLTQIGGASVSIRGALRVGTNTTLEALNGTLGLDGVIVADSEMASLDLIQRTLGLIAMNESVHVPDGRSLAITMAGQRIGLTFDSVDQFVMGGGVLHNDILLSGGASMMPGSITGTFTVDGDYTQLDDAILQIELGGTAAGRFDVLNVTGLFDAGGILELRLIDGFVPTGGELFDILDFGSPVPGSAFDQIILPQLSPGLAWDTSGLLVTGRVQVAPEPATSWILVVAGGWIMKRRMASRGG